MFGCGEKAEISNSTLNYKVFFCVKFDNDYSLPDLALFSFPLYMYIIKFFCAMPFAEIIVITLYVECWVNHRDHA